MAKTVKTPKLIYNGNLEEKVSYITPSPTVFKASADDPRRHAYVSFGHGQAIVQAAENAGSRDEFEWDEESLIEYAESLPKAEREKLIAARRDLFHKAVAS